MEILISTVDHRDQAYDTAGNWLWQSDGSLTIEVSRLPDERYEVLLAVHELIEAYLCKAAGVPQDAVDAFDLAYEARRQTGDLSEPGDAPDAPYRAQHKFATLIEQLVAHELGVDWASYEAALEALER